MIQSPGDAVADQIWCDLHLHSTNSDGHVAPEDLIEKARRASLRVMSISDHSRPTFDADLEGLAARHGITLLPGLEISTMHHGRKYHVLGYGHGVLDTELQKFAFLPTAVKNATYERVIGRLRAEGVELPATEDMLVGIQEDGPPAHPGKWMLSSTLIGRYAAHSLGMDPTRAAGLVKERYNLLKGREPDRYVPAERMISMIRDAGGIPVLAHPFWECTAGRNSWDGVTSDLRQFSTVGLVGFEVSSRHDSQIGEGQRRDVANALDLIPFRSSDYHGNGKTEIGQFPMPVAHLMEAARRCGVVIPLHGVDGG
ncbi:PHP domain-containing protein [Nonomuraea sp. NPDC051941]|uniref:PHP domain-containing protein n=1 Tax=Nonomuraea sp. NPDC051941 TaxID=3364373 RepID=UPI0037C900E1